MQLPTILPECVSRVLNLIFIFILKVLMARSCGQGNKANIKTDTPTYICRSYPGQNSVTLRHPPFPPSFSPKLILCKTMILVNPPDEFF